MTTERNVIQRLRWLAGAAQAALWLGLPFVRVGGESALRLDVPRGQLHVFGATFGVDELFVVLAATFVVTAALLLVTLVLGRVWCGWSCPQTVLGDATAWAAAQLGLGVGGGLRRRGGRIARAARGGAGLAVIGAVAAVASAGALWYFVPPAEFANRLARGALGPTLGWSWAILGGLLFLDLALLRTRFCATACPYAKLQGVLFDRHTLVVAYDARRAADCVDCGACVRVCPTGIDIRDGLQMECLACGACIDACRPIMARLHRAPDLVRWSFGEPGTPRRLVRPASLALALGLAASIALLVGFVAGRSGLGVVATALDGFAPRATPAGEVVNGYLVALENRRAEPARVALALELAGARVALAPAELTLGPNERRRVKVVARAAGVGGAGPVAGALSAEAAFQGGRRERTTAEVSFLVPEKR